MESLMSGYLMSLSLKKQGCGVSDHKMGSIYGAPHYRATKLRFLGRRELHPAPKSATSARFIAVKKCKPPSVRTALYNNKQREIAASLRSSQ